MANQTIDGLAAGSAAADVDELPFWQGGATVKNALTAVATWIAGRAWTFTSSITCSGGLTISSLGTLLIGNSGSQGKMGRAAMGDITATVSAAGGVETNLNVLSISPNTFQSVGDLVESDYVLTTLAAANNRQIKLYFGTAGNNTDTNIFDSTALTTPTNPDQIVIRVRLLCTATAAGSAVIRATVELRDKTGIAFTTFTYTSLGSLTLSNTYKLTITATGTTDNGVSLVAGKAWWNSAA